MLRHRLEEKGDLKYFITNDNLKLFQNTCQLEFSENWKKYIILKTSDWNVL